MTTDTPTETPGWLPALRISALSLAALVILYTMAWAVSQSRRQGIADDPSRITNVLPGMTVQEVRNALGCAHATDIPTRWHPLRQGFATEALADIRGKRQVLYYEWAMPERPGYRRAYVVFGDDATVSEVRVFDLEIGMTRDAVIRQFGLPPSSSSRAVTDSLAYIGFEGGSERPGGMLHRVEVHFNAAGIVDTISIHRSRAED